MLKSLLQQHDRIYGAICRDVTATDIELMSQIGLHVVWFDLEHGPQTMADAVSLGRLATHLGMVPLVRVPELSRTCVQVLLDGGIRIVVVPDIRSAQQARDLVELGKYPPVGRRGLSSTIAGQGFQMTDPQRDLERENEDVQLMVMIESDEAYDQLDEIVAVDGLDMVSVGPSDWSTSLGLFGDEGETDSDTENRPRDRSVCECWQDRGDERVVAGRSRSLLRPGSPRALRRRRYRRQTTRLDGDARPCPRLPVRLARGGVTSPLAPSVSPA